MVCDESTDGKIRFLTQALCRRKSHKSFDPLDHSAGGD